MKNDYKGSTDLQQRIFETNKIREKYPQKYPIIVQRSPKDTLLHDLDNHKFLVPYDMVLTDFTNIIRRKLVEVNESQSVFFYVGCGKLMKLNDTISQIYDVHHDEDGYLYIYYQGENTFG